MSDLKNVQPLADFNWDEFENGGSSEVSKQEQAARVVEYVLAMVGRVHHCGNGSGRAQLLDDAVQDVVGPVSYTHLTLPTTERV